MPRHFATHNSPLISSTLLHSLAVPAGAKTRTRRETSIIIMSYPGEGYKMSNYGYKPYTPEQVKEQWRESTVREAKTARLHAANKLLAERSKVNLHKLLLTCDVRLCVGRPNACKLYLFSSRKNHCKRWLGLSRFCQVHVAIRV